MNISIGHLFVISFFICVASVTPSPTTSDDGEMKVVCYFSNWAFYRLKDGRYEPDYIDPKLCTHIVYTFAVLDPDELIMKSYEYRVDIGYRTMQRIADSSHQHGVKVLVALGGFEDSFAHKYGRLLSDPSSRRKFVESVVDFIRTYHFDGLELDLEFPTCWHKHCESSRSEEKQHFVQLVKELSQAFKPNGWLLSSVVSANQTIIDAAYDVPQLAQYLDWFSLMTYDYHDSSDLQTGHQSPLYSVVNNLSIDCTIKYFIQKGAPSRKLVMGITSYGKSFTLRNSKNQDLDAPASGPGLAGLIANIPGSLAYYEICDKAKNHGWTVVHNPDTAVGSYAYKNNQWVSFDDVDNVRAKAEFIRRMNLGGGLIRTLDLDDFRGNCGCGKYPLLTALNQNLRAIGGTPVSNCT